MPSEKSVICSIFQLSNDIDELSHSFCLIFDIFRQTSMQVVDLDFVNMNARAHIAIEKCNRLIKGKNRPFRTSDPGARVGYDDSLLRTTMVAPVFAHPAYATSLACFRDSGWQHLLQVRAVHGLVRVWELPANLVAIQARCILEMLQTNSNNIVYSTLLYVCLRCVSRSVKFVINKKMRVMSDESCYCSQCNCISFVIPVSVLGRVVYLGSSRYTTRTRTSATSAAARMSGAPPATSSPRAPTARRPSPSPAGKPPRRAPSARAPPRSAPARCSTTNWVCWPTLACVPSTSRLRTRTIYMMMIAFITFKSSLVPLFEGL